MLKKALIASLFLALLVFLYGCGQQTNTVNSINQASGLTIRGTIRYFDNTGGFTFVIGNPIAGACIKLDGNGQTRTTSANTNGQYQFTGIPDGQYLISATAEGTLYWSPLVPVWIKPSGATPANGTIVTQDLTIYRFAITTGYAPATGSTITRNQTFTVTFNSPMDTSTVRFSLVPQGLRSMADSGDTVQLDQTWATDKRSVTLTPQGQLLPNEKYRLLMDYAGWPAANPYPLDAQGGSYISGVNTPGFSDALFHYADYQTTAEGVPGTPSNLSIFYQPAFINRAPRSLLKRICMISGVTCG